MMRTGLFNHSLDMGCAEPCSLHETERLTTLIGLPYDGCMTAYPEAPRPTGGDLKVHGS